MTPRDDASPRPLRLRDHSIVPASAGILLIVSIVLTWNLLS